jgi:hypothetical protein
MKRIIILLLLLVARPLHACPACDQQQPAVLRGITHGTGPQGDVDYIIVSAMVILTLATLWYSLKTLIRPNESASDHIKNSILDM